MVTARRFESHLESQTPWGKSEVEQRTRRLRDARMLPKGGRGFNAPAIGPEHAATILLALAGSEKAVDCIHAVADLSPIPASSDSFAGCGTFGEALELILDRPDIAAKVEAITINKSWPAAVIEYRQDDASRLYKYENPESVKYPAYSQTVLKGDLLQMLSMAIRPVDSGWTGR